MALVKLEFGVVNEAGALGAAQRVRQEMLNLQSGATATAGTLTDRLGVAFQRLERREPMLAVRAFRSAVDDMAISAIGAQGPLGRLGVTIATLLPGGTLTLGAIGGLAAIGLEVKAIIEFTDGLERSLVKLNQQFAQMVGGGAALAFQAMAATQQAESPDKPNIFLRGIAAVGSRGGFGTGELSDALAIGQESKIATATLEAARFWELFHRGQDTALEKEQAHLHDQAQAINEQAITLGRLKLGPDPSQQALIRFNEQVALIHLGFQNLDEPTKTRIAELIREQTVVQLSNIDLKVRNDLLRAQADIEGGINFPRLFEQINAIPAPAINLDPKDITFNQELSKQILGDATRAQFELTKAMGLSTKSAFEAAQAHKIAAAQIVTAAFGLLSALASGGSAGGILSGVGGIIGFINPVAGAIVSGVGGFISTLDANSESRNDRLIKALEPVGELLFLVAQSGGSAESLDSLVRRMEQATGRRISVRFGGT